MSFYLQQTCLWVIPLGAAESWHASWSKPSRISAKRTSGYLDSVSRNRVYVSRSHLAFDGLVVVLMVLNLVWLAQLEYYPFQSFLAGKTPWIRFSCSYPFCRLCQCVSPTSNGWGCKLHHRRWCLGLVQSLWSIYLKIAGSSIESSSYVRAKTGKFYHLSLVYYSKQKIDLGTIMSRINGFVGRRDLLKLVVWRVVATTAAYSWPTALLSHNLLLKKTSTS